MDNPMGIWRGKTLWTDRTTVLRRRPEEKLPRLASVAVNEVHQQGNGGLLFGVWVVDKTRPREAGDRQAFPGEDGCVPQV